MAPDYLIVANAILPEEYEKVIDARELLQSKEAATVTEAVKRCGISRNTYYKYKDYVFRPSEVETSRKAVISMILKNETGALSEVLKVVSSSNASILTISQSAPADQKASVILALDIRNLNGTVAGILVKLQELPSVQHVHLDAME